MTVEIELGGADRHLWKTETPGEKIFPDFPKTAIHDRISKMFIYY